MQNKFAKALLSFAASLLLAHAPSTALAASSHPAFKVDVHGSAGQPVILIPGLASSGEVWNGTVAHYCGQRQCHVLTLAGFGGNPAAEGPLLAGAEQQLSDYIATNKLERPIVIGHSLGGFLGMKLAADHPDQVGRLIIIDSLPALGALHMPSVTGAQLKQMAAGMRQQFTTQPPAAFAATMKSQMDSMVTKQSDNDALMAMSSRSDRAAVINAMADMMGEDLRDDVARIKAPTLVLGTWIAYKQYATRDNVEATFKTQYRQLPGVTIELADNARHFMMYDDPNWMYDRIDNFLK
jgi:pimeloyl-ACP methyl ester carboxylesterase